MTISSMIRDDAARSNLLARISDRLAALPPVALHGTRAAFAALNLASVAMHAEAGDFFEAEARLYQVFGEITALERA